MANAAALAGGVSPQQQTPPPQGGNPNNVQVAPGDAQGGDKGKIIQALEMDIKNSVDQNGYVDMNKLVQQWPQVAQQLGLNIPFQTVMQMVQQDPSLIEDIINQMGLSGIIVNGKQISAEQLLAQGQSGGSAATAAGPAVNAQQGAPAPVQTGNQGSPGNMATGG